MRRSDKEITDLKQIDEIIHNSFVCRLALSLDNKPYIVPISFGYDGTCIYFHTAVSGKKIDYFLNNNNVCFEFDQNVEIVAHADRACNWSNKYESVIGFGVVSELLAAEEKTHGLNEIMKHYSGEEWEFDVKSLQSTRVWKIDIDSKTGKRSD